MNAELGSRILLGPWPRKNHVVDMARDRHSDFRSIGRIIRSIRDESNDMSPAPGILGKRLPKLWVRRPCGVVINRNDHGCTITRGTIALQL